MKYKELSLPRINTLLTMLEQTKKLLYVEKPNAKAVMNNFQYMENDLEFVSEKISLEYDSKDRDVMVDKMDRINQYVKSIVGGLEMRDVVSINNAKIIMDNIINNLMFIKSVMLNSK